MSRRPMALAGWRLQRHTTSQPQGGTPSRRSGIPTSASAWGVGEYHDSVAELRYIDEIQGGSVFDCLKHVLASSYSDRCHQEVELVDQTVLHQGGIEWTIPVFDDVAARLLL